MSGRRAAKVDTNHAAVRDGLRALGWSVFDTSGVGDGFSDFVVGVGGQRLPFPPDPRARGAICTGDVFLVEVKTTGGRLTERQQEFAWEWRGNWIVGETVEEIAAAIQAMRRKGGPR